MEIDFEKVTTILQWLIPSTLKKLQGFLGLIGHYIIFIKNYSILAWPSTQSLWKDASQWNETVDTTFLFIQTSPHFGTGANYMRFFSAFGIRSGCL